MTEATPNPNIAVIGSLNVDTILSVPYFPESGATVAATDLQRRYGGKGANQALAASRQGGIVSLIGCVGDDGKGNAYLDYLTAQGLNVHGVQIFEETETGAAYITVNPNAENTIIFVPAANACLDEEIVTEQHAIIDSADVVLCQFEVPIDAVVCALQRAAELNKTTILNPSPLSTEFPWGQVPVDFLIMNELESASLFGYFVQDTNEASKLRAQMADLGVSTLIITRGADPTLVFSAHQAFKVPPPTIQAVDTTGAGDAFMGAFAVHWAQTHNLLSSIRKANIAGALATLQVGAQDALPSREAVDEYGKAPVQAVVQEQVQAEAYDEEEDYLAEDEDEA